MDAESRLRCQPLTIDKCVLSLLGCTRLAPAVDLERHLVRLGQESFGHAQQSKLVFRRANLGKSGLDDVDAQGDRADTAEITDFCETLP